MLHLKVHTNMQSHMVVVMTLGGGAIYRLSTKQKLNMRSSTKAELFSAKDALPRFFGLDSF